MTLFFGNEETPGGASEAIGAARVWCTRVKPSSAGKLETLKFYLGTTVAFSEFWVGIYAGTEAEPTTTEASLAEVNKVEKPAGSKFITVTLGTPLNLDPTKWYWVALLFKGGSGSAKLVSGGTTKIFKASTNNTKLEKVSTWTEVGATGPWGLQGLGTAEPHEGTGRTSAGFTFFDTTRKEVSATGRVTLGIDFSEIATKTGSHEGTGKVSIGFTASGVGFKGTTTSSTASAGFDFNSESESEPPGTDLSPGSEVEQTGKLKQVVAEQAFAAKLPPFTKAGFVKKYKALPTTTVAGVSKLEFAICEDESGKPGKVIASAVGEGEVKAGVWFEAGKERLTGLIVPGHQYWIVVRGIVGGLTMHMQLAEGAGTGLSKVFVGKAKSKKKINEIIPSEWVEGAVELGFMNAVALGNIAPQTTASITDGIDFISTTGAERSGVARIALGADFFAEGSGPVARVKVRVGTTVTGEGEKRVQMSGRLSAGFDFEASGTEGTAKITKYGLGEKQETWVFPGKNPGVPIVAVFHGGGWVSEQWESTRVYAEGIYKETGFAVFHVNYADASETQAAFPVQISDAELFVRWVKENAATFNGNPNKIYFVGGSAGGHIVAAAAEKLNASKKTVSKVVCLSGIYDLQKLFEEMEIGEYREFPGGGATKHGGGSVDDLTLHLQEALQQTLNESWGPSSKEPPLLEGKPLSNTTESRVAQALYSPSRHASPFQCQYLLFQAEVDLIPNSSLEAMESRLLGEGRPFTAHRVPENPGHAFSYWGHGDPVATVKSQIITFLKESSGDGVTSSGTNLRMTAGAPAHAGAGSLSAGFDLSFSSTRDGKARISAGVDLVGGGEREFIAEATTSVGTSFRGRGVGSHAGAGTLHVGVNISGEATTIGIGRITFGERLSARGTRSTKGSGTTSAGVHFVGRGVVIPVEAKRIVLVVDITPKRIVLVT